jgi:hypothetical protein
MLPTSHPVQQLLLVSPTFALNGSQYQPTPTWLAAKLLPLAPLVSSRGSWSVGYLAVEQQKLPRQQADAGDYEA